MFPHPIENDDASPFLESPKLLIPASFGRTIELFGTGELFGIDDGVAWSWQRGQMRGLRGLRAAAPPLTQGAV